MAKVSRKLLLQNAVEVDDNDVDNENGVVRTIGRSTGKGTVLNAFASARPTSELVNSSEIKRIKISELQKDPANEFIISDIQGLASLIEESGQLYPILVTKNPEYDEDNPDSKQWLVIDGERRLTAIEYLNKKYEESDRIKAKVYSTILAVETTDEDGAKHLYANSGQREISNLEKVLSFHPERMDGTAADKSVLIAEKINKMYSRNPEQEAINSRTVQNILSFINNASDKLMDAVKKEVISYRDARLLVRLPMDVQDKAVDARADETAYMKYLVMANPPKSKKEKSMDAKAVCNAVKKKTNKFEKELEKIFKEANELDQDGVTAKQQKYLEKAKQITELIKELKEMKV